MALVKTTVLITTTKVLFMMTVVSKHDLVVRYHSYIVITIKSCLERNLMANS